MGVRLPRRPAGRLAAAVSLLAGLATVVPSVASFAPSTAVLAPTIASLAALAAFAPPAGAQAHAEIMVGVDADGRLVVDVPPGPHPLPPSRFVGVRGYSDAFPGIFSRTAPSADGAHRPLRPGCDLEFAFFGADEGMGVMDERGSLLMKPGETFGLGAPVFDMHPLWVLDGEAEGEVFTLRMVVRDREKKHGDSDLVEVSFRRDESQELYSCPMNCVFGFVSEEPGRCSVCRMRLKLVSGREYRASVVPEPDADAPLVAGEEVRLRFRFATPRGEPVTELEVVHEKLLHLLIVSDDLSWFAHEHPVIQDDGSFLLDFTFPRGGTFVLYNDFTPVRVGMQVVPVELEVQGERHDPVPLTVTEELTQHVDGYDVTLVLPEPFPALRNLPLRFRIERDGEPVTDLQPFLGAMGHLVVLSDGREHFVHSHPLEKLPEEGPTPTGPDVEFHALFPAPGLYKAWSQFQHDGTVITVPWVFEVARPW